MHKGEFRGVIKFTQCQPEIQEYRTTALLGCETDSYDSNGARVHLLPYLHIIREDVENILDKFRGEIRQMPPVCVL